MDIRKKLISILLVLAVIFGVTACSPIDKDYGVASDESAVNENEKSFDNSQERVIMSSDRVMSKYFDISLFDEENYADIYLGKRFEINAMYMGQELPVPIKIEDIKKLGWNLAEGNAYDENSLVFAYETVDATLINEDGVKLQVQFYNSSRSSVKLSKCYIVKYIIKNDFYKNPDKYKEFHINGINNKMAITDIVQILGTPSHFYRVSEDSYYLDYFITKKDRRNGITIYINPQEDSITAIEFSFYK